MILLELFGGFYCTRHQAVQMIGGRYGDESIPAIAAESGLLCEALLFIEA